MWRGCWGIGGLHFRHHHLLGRRRNVSFWVHHGRRRVLQPLPLLLFGRNQLYSVWVRRNILLFLLSLLLLLLLLLLPVHLSPLLLLLLNPSRRRTPQPNGPVSPPQPNDLPEPERFHKWLKEFHNPWESPEVAERRRVKTSAIVDSICLALEGLRGEGGLDMGAFSRWE